MANEQLTFDFFDDLPEKPDAEQIARITLKNWREHLKAVGLLERQITKLLDEAVKEAARLGKRIKPEDIGRAFSKNPSLRKNLDSTMQKLAEDLTATIEQGSKDAWLRSNTTGNAIIVQMAAGNTALAALLQSQQNKAQNDRALLSFQQREVAGMNLSERVWKLVGDTQRDMERAVEVALAEGTPVTKLSQRVRELLQEPHRLYRRVRDKDGNLQLSQAAQQYHPGRGVYRSSYKNAMRLARTEVNMAYHTADNERWQNSWWVRGIRIGLSNNHTVQDSKGKAVPLIDICDELAGDYPADFKFTGWHPQCRCIATAITCSYDDIRDYYRRKRAGEDMTGYTPPGTIKEPPAEFKNWLTTNTDRLAGAAERGTTPYFIRDNAKYTGAKVQTPTQPQQAQPKNTIAELTAERHSHRTPDDILNIQFRWSRRQANQIMQAYNSGHLPSATQGKVNALFNAVSWGNLKTFDATVFNAQAQPLLAAARRHAARTKSDVVKIRKRWNASRIENAGETAKVTELRKAIELKKITSIADIQRIMRVFYDQFPEEFNNIRIQFIEFNEPIKGRSYMAGYSRHNQEIAFNSAPFGSKPSTMENIIKAMQKVCNGKKLSLAQHKELITIVHELLHQKAGRYVGLRGHYQGDYKRTAMESMNELAARATYVRFLRRLGANTEGAELIMRKGDGYLDWEKRLLAFIDHAGQSPTAVGEQFATTLISEPYDTMDAELYKFFKTHAKKNFTQSMNEVLEAFESGKGWSAMLSKWFS